MKLFLDASILIDIILERNMEKTSIEAILPSITSRDICISLLSVHVAYYTLRIKHGSHLDIKMKAFLDLITLIPLTEVTIRRALDSTFKDFEDLLQYFSAVGSCDYLLTRNIEDFRKIKEFHSSSIKVIGDLKEIPLLSGLK